MKTKHYEFTEVEMLALRESLDFYWFEKAKDLKPNSPLFKRVNKAVRPLLDQFTNDIFQGR